MSRLITCSGLAPIVVSETPSPSSVPLRPVGETGRAIVSWSSGKDAAWALHLIEHSKSFEGVGLLTTVTETYQRVSMHGVRESILESQAASVGLPLVKVRIPVHCPNSIYETKMAEALGKLREDGVTHVVFGDLFLEDIRAYREEKLKSTGIQPVFPLWRRDTRSLANEMIAGGLVARVVCLDPRKLSKTFAGRLYDSTFLSELPPSVDPCGENGEFHTCVLDGPMFRRPIEAKQGEVVERDGYVFADLIPE